MNSSKEYCFVHGPMSVVLRMSRIYGVAPVSLESHGGAYLAQVSPRLTIYSKLLLSALIVLTIAGFAMDSLYIGTNKGVKVRSYSSLVVWLIDISMVTSVTSIGVYRGPSRMRRMMRHLIRVEKVHQTLSKGTNTTFPSSNKQLSRAVVGLLLTQYFIMAMDFWSYVLQAQTFEKDMTIVYLYGFHYIGYSMLLLLQMQVALVILSVQLALKALNNSIKELIENIELKAKEKSCTIINNAFAFRRQITTEQPSQKSVREFADCFVNICNMVREVNEEEGMLLFIMFMAFIAYLFVTSYYLISVICLHTGTIETGFNVLLQLSWCIFNCLTIMVIVEPCHRTHEEMIDTQMLVSQMTFFLTPIGEPVPLELDCLQKQLFLSKPTYSPLNICTLSRSQVAAIFTGVSTYLIIIIQQRLIDECK